jgi:ParB family chromosome partitioning protein
MSKSRLGKGLDALLSSTVQSPQNSPSREAETDKAKQINAGATGPLEVAVGDITPSPYQPRREFDEGALAELAASIAAQGVLQPLVVRTKAQGGFEMIAASDDGAQRNKLGCSKFPWC